MLTYRGREKALDLLRRFDRDHDDKLDFSDFRGYLEHFGRSVAAETYVPASHHLVCP